MFVACYFSQSAHQDKMYTNQGFQMNVEKKRKNTYGNEFLPYDAG